MHILRGGIIHLAQISSLFDQYRQFHQQPSDVKSATEFVKARLNARDSAFLLAVSDKGTGMGFTQLYPSFSSVAMKKTWTVNDLYVDAKYRNQGVATALMQATKQFAKQSGAFSLKLATAKNNIQAKSIYSKVGFKQLTEFDYYTLVEK